MLKCAIVQSHSYFDNLHLSDLGENIEYTAGCRLLMTFGWGEYAVPGVSLQIIFQKEYESQRTQIALYAFRKSSN